MQVFGTVCVHVCVCACIITGVCLCVCVHMHRSMCVHMHRSVFVCVIAHVDVCTQRSAADVQCLHQVTPHFVFGDRVSHWTWTLLIQLD